MADSRYGNLLLLIGGIHTLLVFVLWMGVLVNPLGYSTWVGTNLQTPAFWLVLFWCGALVLQLGYSLRSGHVELTEVTGSLKAVIYTAAVMAVFGLLATIILSAVYFL